MSSDPATNEGGQWRRLFEELGRRTREPARQPPFVGFVLTGVVLFGGLGIWVELLKLSFATGEVTYDGLETSIITFYPALIGSSAIQLVLACWNKDKSLMSVGITTLCFSFVAAILLALSEHNHPYLVLTAGSALSCFAIWLWWITNGDDPTFKAATPIDAATGGEVDRQLPGTLTGYKV